MYFFLNAKMIVRALALSSLIMFGTSLSMPASATSLEEAVTKLEAMNWYTEEYPPYNYAGDDGTPTGMAVDVLLAAFKKMGVKTTAKDFKITSWSRSYKYVQRKPGTALFSMTITPERQKIVKFVGPAIPLVISIIAKKDSGIVIRSNEDLNQLSIGVVSKDIGDQLIGKLSLSNPSIKRINSAEQLHALLKNGQVDVVAYSLDVFKNTVKKTGDNPGDFTGVHVLNEGQAGYAFHPSTDPAVLEHLQTAIEGLKADGSIDKIIAGYNN